MSTAVTAVGLAVAFGGDRVLKTGRQRLGWTTDSDGLLAHYSKWAWMALLLGFVVVVEGKPLSSVGFRPVDPAYFVAASIAGTLVLLTSSAAAEPLSDALGLDGLRAEEGMGQFTDYSTGERLFVALTAGVTEEVVVHGYVIERLLTLTGSPVLAGGVSFAGFTLLHLSGWNRDAVVQIALPALLTTLMYLYFRNVWILIAIHALNDAVGLLLAERYVDESG